MITADVLREILNRLNEASQIAVEDGNSGATFVPETLEEIGIDSDTIVEFAQEVSANLILSGAEQDANLSEIVASAVVLGIQLGVYAERGQINGE